MYGVHGVASLARRLSLLFAQGRDEVVVWMDFVIFVCILEHVLCSAPAGFWGMKTPTLCSFIIHVQVRSPGRVGRLPIIIRHGSTRVLILQNPKPPRGDWGASVQVRSPGRVGRVPIINPCKPALPAPSQTVKHYDSYSSYNGARPVRPVHICPNAP